MTIMSQDKRDLLNSLETIKEHRSHQSYQLKPTQEPSVAKKVFTALAGGIVGVFVAPFIFLGFVLLVGFAIMYGMKGFSVICGYLFSAFHSL